MRAVRVHRYQEDPLIDDVAEPTATGPWDVVVEIGAAGLCRTDLHVIEGQWDAIQHPKLPYILGHENAGWVREVGSAVTNVQPGDTVIMHPIVTCGLCLACREGQDSHCENSTFPGLNVDGGMAEMMKTNARSVVKLDPSLRPADIAALADAGLTAYHAVRKAAPLLHPGTHAVVIGSGGLGHIGIQSLKALTSAQITVVDTSEEALELATALGADHTLSQAGDGGKLLEITGGGAHVVFDFVGEHGTEALGLNVLRNRGSYYTIGYGGAVNIDTIEIISREINIVGNLVGTYLDLVELMTLTAQGQVTLHTQTYDLEDAVQAMHDLDSGKLVGRGILVPNLTTQGR
ncbi:MULTISPECIES: NAD(P)-dependent alcohol dehydrogenase [unclassified Arthrobacter]|uniref:NAD(P)-dependent alcohol dehydrogenase n=1 Tax=unclassified Arthrobacter TaxID=235627 RepID=UPI0002E09890|nr:MULTISPECIES: NAD(P)-dependent alcohol dehydrogenase [unclassified Arthrobacter]PVE19161.1 NAD(P)-dependent alcohol dehydrogenase [Arthrobacter sp. Bz4]